MRRRIMPFMLILCTAGPAAAQRSAGIVRDSATHQPIPGALITFRDSTRRTVLRVLTDSAGRFDATTPLGSSIVTAEFIGYTTQQQNINPERRAIFNLAPAPYTLAKIVATGKRECKKSDDPSIANAWYAARTALGTARAVKPRTFRTRDFKHPTDLGLRPTGPDSMIFNITRAVDSYFAISSDSLARYGYVRRVRDGALYYGPDAELLLSDQFVDTHCFGLTRDRKRHPGFVGLTFWPKTQKRLADIHGTMWINETSSQLRTVDFYFTGFSDKVDEKLRSGDLEIDRLPGVGLVVQRYHIRVPRIASGKVIGGFEGGGELLGLGEAVPLDEAGTISGFISDSTGHAALGNAIVFLAGTNTSVKVDEQGRFTFNSVTPGIYYIGIRHPLTAPLSAYARLQRIEVAPRKQTDTHVAIPSEKTIIEALCNENVPGVFFGRIRHDGTPATDVTVFIGKIGIRTDANGDYVLCGTPSVGIQSVIVSRANSLLFSSSTQPLGRATRYDIDF